MAAGRVAHLAFSAQRRHLHVVQISRDSDLLRLPHDSEPVRRQLDYARELTLRAPDSSVTIIVVTPAPATSGWQRDGVRVVALPANVSIALALPRMLRAMHRVTPISVITTQVPYDEAWLALLVGRFCRIPVIAQVHSDLFAAAPRTGIARRAARAAHHWMTRRILGAFTAVRTVSSSNRTAASRFARRVPITTIPVPVEMVTTGRATSRTTSAREPLVLFVGRLAPEKDLMTWLQVARAVSNAQSEARFLLVGDGPERERLQQTVLQLGLEKVVEFAGFVPHSALADFYARASVVMLTSPSEGCPRVLIEAASQGTPAVSTISAGPKDIVVNGVTGFLHDVGDVRGLAHSVATLLRDPRRTATMGSQARAFVSVKFDPRRLRSEWVGLWVDIARQAHRS